MANPGPSTTVSAHPQNVLTNQALRLVATLTNVSANTTANYAVPVINTGVFLPQALIVTNMNANGANVGTTTGLAVGVSTTSGGSSLYGSVTIANLTNVNGVSVTSPTAQTTALTTQTLYVNVTALTTPVAGATFDVYVYCYDFSTPLL